MQEGLTDESSMNKFVISLAYATLLTGISYTVAVIAGWMPADRPEFQTALEVFAVFTSYSCTIMCVLQTRWNYPMGLLSTLAYVWLFFEQDLIASSILNAYLCGAIIYGYIIWGPDGNPRPVRKVRPVWWIGYAVLLAVAFVIASLTFAEFDVLVKPIDMAILVISVLAQFLLDRKKLETWLVWTGVNLIAIPWYLSQGLPLVSFQYVFFLFNAVWGYHMWSKSMDMDFYRAINKIGVGHFNARLAAVLQQQVK